MKIEIRIFEEKIQVIEADLPYYYKHKLVGGEGDCVIYGKIEQHVHTSIQETTRDGDIKYEIERERHSAIKDSGLSNYFDERYASSGEEYKAARERCMAFLEQC